MDNKKKLKNEFKERMLIGGVYAIANSRKDKRILGHAVDLRAAQNRFDFSVAIGSCVFPELETDWKESGGRDFVFEVLEELEIKPDQSREEFKDDLITLEELWLEKLGRAGSD